MTEPTDDRAHHLGEALAEEQRQERAEQVEDVDHQTRMAAGIADALAGDPEPTTPT